MINTFRLALIGFGNVGQGVAEILSQKSTFYQQQFNINIVITAVCTRSKGSIYHPGGIEPQFLLDTFRESGRIDTYPADYKNWDVLKTIRESNADVIVEMSYTDLKTGEPATTYIKTALESHKHVVSTNKGPVVLSFPEIDQLAKKNGVELGYEGTVMCGSPVVHLGKDDLKAAGITKIEGIINGTTNFILSRMEGGVDFGDALKEAQQLGYAEADPTADVEGYDAASKALILAKTLLGATLSLSDIQCQGITGLTSQDIQDAKNTQQIWKLIASVVKEENTWKVNVAPKLLPLSHPLAQVTGTTNAVTFTTDLLGQVSLVGPGAGKLQTGYAVILDVLDINKKVNGE